MSTETQTGPDEAQANALAAIFGGQTTLHFGGDRQAYLLLPIVPPK